MFSKQPKGATIYDDKKSGVTGLLWMLFGAVVTIIVGVVAYKSGKFDFAQETTTDETTEVISKNDSDEPTIKPKPQEDKKYEFYEVLPKQDMVSVPDNSLIAEEINEDKDQLDAKKFHPDVVVTGETIDKTKAEDKNSPTSEQTDQQTAPVTTTSNNTDNSLATSDNKKVTAKQPVTGDDELVIVYENSTYEDTSIKKSIKKVTPTEKTKPMDTASKNTNKKETSNSQSSQSQASNVQTNKFSNDKASNNKALDNGALNKNSSSIKTNQIAKKAEKSTKEKKAEKAVAKPVQPEKKAYISKASNNSKPVISSGKSYILQINSYDNATDADKRRAQVLMAGVDASVIKNTTNNTLVYQVVSKSMNSPTEVIRAQQRLHKNGIDSLIVEQRRK